MVMVMMMVVVMMMERRGECRTGKRRDQQSCSQDFFHAGNPSTDCGPKPTAGVERACRTAPAARGENQRMAGTRNGNTEHPNRVETSIL